VLIAWAIVDRPQVLLFDEPTSNVDVGSQETIFRALLQARRELQGTVLLVTHDVHATRRLADEVLVLDRSVLFQGTPLALLNEKALLQRVFGIAPEMELSPIALAERT
jgi:ABC-type Mn2+/Zn2+ transport system ATPase subunit